MDVQFDEDNNLPTFQANRLDGNSHYSFITRWVIKAGLAKDERGANIALFIIMILAFAASAFITYATLFNHPAPKVVQPTTMNSTSL